MKHIEISLGRKSKIAIERKSTRLMVKQLMYKYLFWHLFVLCLNNCFLDAFSFKRNDSPVCILKRNVFLAVAVAIFLLQDDSYCRYIVSKVNFNLFSFVWNQLNQLYNILSGNLRSNWSNRLVDIAENKIFTEILSNH